MSSLRPGTRARVKTVEGGHAMAQRLAAIGVYAGVDLLVVRGGRDGPVITDVRGTRIIIGRGMASRLMVAPLS
ncbi:MAG: ferrous iron transport protein A [Kiritimatiellae bacterium]|nr:ferrous iron transport protein A [Kiritimatiellia bacterium]